MRLRATRSLGINAGNRRASAWTPASLGADLSLWLDAADASTLTFVPQPFTALICIGDSWTQGRAWPQTVCTQLNIPFSAADNFAIGGARVLPSSTSTNLLGQVTNVLNAQSNVLNPTHMYAVIIGGNDLLAGGDPIAIIAETKLRLQTLINAGARWFLLDTRNAVALLIPAANDATLPLFEQLARLQQTMVLELQNSNPEITFVQYSSGDFLEAVAQNPSKFNTTAQVGDPTGFFFGGDGLHMNNNGYVEMGKWIANAITVNARATISQWSDKSINAKHATQSNASQRPIYITQGSPQGENAGLQRQNSLPSLRFNGIDNSLICPGLGARTGVTAYVITKLRSIPSGSYRNTIVGEWANGFSMSGSNSWLLAAGDGGTGQNPLGYVEIGNPGSNLQPRVIASTPKSNDYYMLGVRHNGTVLEGWLDGTSTGTTSAIGTINNITSTPVTIAKVNNFSNESAIDVCEIVVLLSSATNEIRQRIEGYLSWKWGMEANLPAGHPFRNTPPTV